MTRTDPVGRRGLTTVAAVALAGLAVFAIAPAARAEPDPSQVAESLRRASDALTSLGRYEVAGQWILSARTLPRLYAESEFRLLWPEPGAAEALLGEIAASEGDGLTPADYHFDVLMPTLERKRAGPDDAEAAAHADLLLTDALIRLVAHLRLGKIQADGTPRWDLPGRVDHEESVDLIRRILAGGGLAGRLGDLRPAQPIYGRLKAALARYRVIAAGSGWPFIGPGPALKPGKTDTRVATLRRRLALTGDFLETASDDPTYDTKVMAAVQNFQRRHGLETDGVVGPATRKALNEPVAERIDEIRANLERARQVLAGVRGRFVLVDPAARRVMAVSDSSPIDTQPADFASGYLHLPAFRASMAYVVVNPDWTLPPGLVSAQVAPLARRIPARLEAMGLSVLTDDGRRLDPGRADWSRPDALVVRQAPGEKSFLGTARLAFPNDAGVTLHGRGGDGGDIPGVVSIPDPLALAAAVLGPEVGRAELDGLAASGRTRTYPVRRSVMVVFSPWTAWAATDGSVVFQGGFESEDRTIIAGLDQRAAP